MAASSRWRWQALVGLLTVGLSSAVRGQEPSAPTPPAAVTDARPPLVEPLPVSQQSPFTIPPGPPAAGNDRNTFAGFAATQDLSRLLPGNFEETKYKWYGFVRLDSTYDFRPIAGTDSFVTSAIPVPQGRGQNTALTPRYSRLGFDTETPIKELDSTVRTRIEMDFFNGNNSGAFGSFPLRLRFAWAEFGVFRVGQDASLFMDYDVFPNGLDYQGPPGMILMRQPVASVRLPIGDRVKLGLGVEQPYSDIQWLDSGAFVANPGSGIIATPNVPRNVQDVPDVTANARYDGDYGHAQVAGVGRKLTYLPAVGNAYDEFGYGGNVTATFHPWAALSGTPRGGADATPMSKSRFLGQFAAGRGINRYFQDPNGLGLDATFDPVNGFRAVPAYGGFLAYEQWWSKKFLSNFTYSGLSLDLPDALPGSTYKRGQYATVNLIWLPVPRMGVGLEFLYGQRENKDGQRGEAYRIQSGVQYKF